MVQLTLQIARPPFGWFDRAHSSPGQKFDKYQRKLAPIPHSPPRRPPIPTHISQRSTSADQKETNFYCVEEDAGGSEQILDWFHVRPAPRWIQSTNCRIQRRESIVVSLQPFGFHRLDARWLRETMVRRQRQRMTRDPMMEMSAERRNLNVNPSNFKASKPTQASNFKTCTITDIVTALDQSLFLSFPSVRC
jgi:hypothetical protein